MQLTLRFNWMFFWLASAGLSQLFPKSSIRTFLQRQDVRQKDHPQVMLQADHVDTNDHHRQDETIQANANPHPTQNLSPTTQTGWFPLRSLYDTQNM